MCGSKVLSSLQAHANPQLIHVTGFARLLEVFLPHHLLQCLLGLPSLRVLEQPNPLDRLLLLHLPCNGQVDHRLSKPFPRNKHLPHNRYLPYIRGLPRNQTSQANIHSLW
jgi:hypothetical protein